MKFLLASALLVAGVSGQEGVHHSANVPKLVLYFGDETAGITNHAEANTFCQAQGRVLASEKEWCSFASKSGDEYGRAPIRSGNYIDIDNVCGAPKQKVQEENGSSKPSAESLCSKPANCVGNSCAFTSDLPHGYYPDPTDCSAYCFSTGTAAPSRWEKVQPGLVWDPYCGGSSPLDEDNKPLGGTTGGCANWDAAVKDKSHCSTGAHRRLAEGDNDEILCTLLSKAKALPQTCASTYDDPHVKTFDGLGYDCQGDGDFILSKSLDSDFEFQGRFHKLDGRQGTTTTAAVLKTGTLGEPKVEAAYDDQCNLRYYIDETEYDLDANWSGDGTLATGTDKVQFFRSDKERYFFFPDSGISFHITMRVNHIFGCFMNVKLCLPDEIKTQRIVGLLGSPDGDQSDDFMDRDGTDLKTVGKIYWGEIHDYCTTTWCIGRESKSLFMEAGTIEQCEAPYDDTLEEAVKNADPELKEVCGDDLPCLIDGTVSGDVEIGKETLNDEENIVGEEAVPDEKEDDSDNEEEPHNAPPKEEVAPDELTPADKTSDKAFTKGDPHFKTFGGEMYDYHGECDLVLLHNPLFKEGLGMDVHIRTKITDLWSSVEKAAIKIGDETLEINGGNKDKWLWINGDANEELAENKWYHGRLSGFLVRFKQNGPVREVNIYVEGTKEVLTMKTYNDFVRIDVNWKESQNYDGSIGLLGSRALDGSRVGRDGQTLIKDVNEFGQEWQVQGDEDMLFHSYEGAVDASNKCILPMTETVQKQFLRKRRLAESGLTMDDVEKACGHLEDAAERKACQYDVLATQDINMASAW